MGEVAFSCVIDNKPKFLLQLDIFLTTLLDIACVEPADTYVHFTYEDQPVFRKLDTLGVNHTLIERFGDGAYCNKISQLDNKALRNYKYVALCDADLAFSEDPRPHLPDLVWGAAGCVVDFPNPPIDIIHAIAKRLGCEGPNIDATTIEGFPTYYSNLNGGFYLLRGDALEEFRNHWRRLALEMLADEKILALLGAQYEKHVDQLAFAFSCSTLKFHITHLPRTLNYALHVPPNIFELMPLDERPAIIHVHDQVDWQGRVNHPPDFPHGDVIEKINSHLNNSAMRRRILSAENTALGRKDSASKCAVIVTGFHRSGTSLLGAGMSALGLWSDSDNLMEGDADNPKGYFEDERVVALNNRILARLNTHWATPAFNPVAPFHERPLLDELSDVCTLLSEFNNEADAWSVKDPRFSITLPLWRSALKFIDDARPIQQLILLRDPFACANSQKKRHLSSPGYDSGLLHITGLHTDETLMSWITHYHCILHNIVHGSGGDDIATIVTYDSIIEDPQNVLNGLAEILDRELAPLEAERFVDEFVDPSLNRSSQLYAQETYWTAASRRLYGALKPFQLKKLSPADAQNIIQEFDELFQSLERFAPAANLLGRNIRLWRNKNIAYDELDEEVYRFRSRALDEESAQNVIVRLSAANQAVEEERDALAGELSALRKTTAKLAVQADAARELPETAKAVRSVFGDNVSIQEAFSHDFDAINQWDKQKKALEEAIADMARLRQRHFDEDSVARTVRSSARYRLGDKIISTSQRILKACGLDRVAAKFVRKVRR